MNEPSPAVRRRARAGVREVAELAGVSTQTVSRVLNNSTNLREETRNRVLDAMAELDYRPNNAARALGTSTTRTLGVIATDVTLHGPSLAIAALASAARAADRWIAAAYADASDEASVDAALSHLLGQGVDGIVLVAPHARTRDALVSRSRGLPIVIMHAGSPDRQAEAVSMIVDHLIDLGHHRIARVGGPTDWLEEASRRQGFERALAAHDLQAVLDWSGDWSARSGAALGPQVAETLRRSDGPTAIVVANDQMALGLMSALHDLGIDVPRDVSITGFDDNPDAAFYQPPLTTVRLDVAGEASRCVAEIFGPGGEHPAEPPTLVVRASTASPR